MGWGKAGKCCALVPVKLLCHPKERTELCKTSATLIIVLKKGGMGPARSRWPLSVWALLILPPHSRMEGKKKKSGNLTVSSKSLERRKLAPGVEGDLRLHGK